MLTLQQIIDEAYTLVPNEVPVADQVIWLNNINADFFNTVKIPKKATFTTVKGQATYVMPNEVQERNVDLVMLGVLKYRNLYEEDVSPLQNNYGFDDTNHSLTLSPAPYQSGLQGVLRYRRVATTTFVSSNLNVSPDIPTEYQWSVIPALASYLANTQDDTENAAYYSAQYQTAWKSAAVDFAGGPA